MSKILKLECRGLAAENGINSRVTAFNEFLRGMDGREYHLEFSYGYKNDRKFLHLQTYYYDENGQCYGNSQFEKEIWDMELEYTKENILSVANMLLDGYYTDIEFI